MHGTVHYKQLGRMYNETGRAERAYCFLTDSHKVKNETMRR
jgi:hypothetical protein